MRGAVRQNGPVADAVIESARRVLNNDFVMRGTFD